MDFLANMPKVTPLFTGIFLMNIFLFGRKNSTKKIPKTFSVNFEEDMHDIFLLTLYDCFTVVSSETVKAMIEAVIFNNPQICHSHFFRLTF